MTSMAPSAQPAPPRQTVQVTARALVAIEPRADQYRAAWDERRDQYDDAYAKPTSWTLTLDACHSTVASNQRRDDLDRRRPFAWAWSLTPLESQGAAITRTSGPGSRHCRTRVGLRALGRWRIDLTVTGLDGVTKDTHSMTRNFRDLLVLAIGDSYSSGEGNPDPFLENGAQRVWTDSQCHRSRYAWPALVAQSLQTASTTVTFLSFACAGAKFEHLTRTEYEGISPGTDDPLDPQVQAARALLGDPLQPATRDVDVLLATAGGNDLGFSGILRSCFFPGGARCQRSLTTQLAELSGSFDELEVALAAKLRVRHAYLAEYPNRVFTNAAGLHEACFGNMSRDDAVWVTQQGARMNARLRAAARRNGWTAVPTVHRFARRGYCASIDEKTQFRKLGNNLFRTTSVAHPNHRGHKAMRDAVVAAIDTGVAPSPVSRLAVRFLNVRVADAPGSWNGTLRLAVKGWLSACGREIELLSGLARNLRVDVSADPCLRYGIQTMGHALAVRAAIPVAPLGLLSAEAVHRRSEGFDAHPFPTPSVVPGHRLEASLGPMHLQVEYRIESTSVIGP